MPTADTAPDRAKTECYAAISDRDLIQRFARSRDEEAFATLVSRHGQLVMGVCRRNLRDEHDAEDAFQATFMVLARKAGQVRWRNSVASWLYRVAVCVAVNARRRNARRPEVELTKDQPTDSDALEEIAQREEKQLLDEELVQLSDRYRLPLLLFHLVGKTRQEVAEILGLSEVGVKAMSKSLFATKSFTLGSAVVCAVLMIAALSGDSGRSRASGNGLPLRVTTAAGTRDDSDAAAEAPVVVTVADSAHSLPRTLHQRPRNVAELRHNLARCGSTASAAALL